MELYNFEAGASDEPLPITSMVELKAALPVVPVNPSIWKLDTGTMAIQIDYGSPDRDHARVFVYTDDGVERYAFDTFSAATAQFLVVARAAFDL